MVEMVTTLEAGSIAVLGVLLVAVDSLFRVGWACKADSCRLIGQL